MASLPYRARTASGDIFDIQFPLHPETADPVRVGQMVTALLDCMEKDIGIIGETSNGDVLQAFAMAMAVRARMIHASQEVVAPLSTALLRGALEAVATADHARPQSGRA